MTECIRKIEGILQTIKNEKKCPSAILSTTNSTYNSLALNSAFRDERRRLTSWYMAPYSIRFPKTYLSVLYVRTHTPILNCREKKPDFTSYFTIYEYKTWHLVLRKSHRLYLAEESIWTKRKDVMTVHWKLLSEKSPRILLKC